MMKFNKKFVGVVLALAMLFSLVAVNVAADGADDATVSTVDIYLDHSTALFGASGSFEITADDGVTVEVVDFVNEGSLSMMIVDKDVQKFNSGASLTAGNFKMRLRLSISGEVGKTAIVTFNYNYMDVAGGDEKTDGVKTVTLEVVDYTALTAALASFDALTESDYTRASWRVASTAAGQARDLLNKSYEQAKVDAAATALNDAIAALVLLDVDYSALEEKVEEAQALNAEDYTAKNWFEFATTLNEAEAFLARADAQSQDEINAMVEELTDAMDALTLIEGSDDRYDEGFADGKAEAESEAESEIESAYDDGFAAGNADKEEAVSEAESEAYAEGYAAGYEAGEDAGYEKGYAAGLAAAGNQGSETPDDNPENPDTPADRYQEGYEAGYKKGYDDGYKQGLIDGAPETDAIEETEPVDTQAPDETETAVPDVTTDEKSSTLWIVLFIVFLTTTLGLAAYIVVTMVLKKKKETDDTPVVDYNIEDDIDTDTDTDTDTDAAGDATADANSDAETDNDAE